MRTFIVLLGPPNVGKGTQAGNISKLLELPHIASGDLFRENIKNQTELGKLAQTFMDRGDLVPDDVTIAMIRNRLMQPDCENGAILDGFPRTPAQADELNKMLQEFNAVISYIFSITADLPTLAERAAHRWICRGHGHPISDLTTDETLPCVQDGTEFYQRDDDKNGTVAVRAGVYIEETAPLVEYYRKSFATVFYEIDGLPLPEVVTKTIAAILQPRVTTQQVAAPSMTQPVSV